MKWETVQINDVSLGVYDGPHATPKPSESGPIFLGIKNITEDGHFDFTSVRHISEEEYPKWTRRVTPKENDIVFSYEATLHRYAIIPEGFVGCLGRRMALIRTDPDRIHYKFLYYYFFSDEWKKEVNNYIINGATVDRIPITNFPDFKLILPPLPTQRRIATILSAYDGLIENNLKRIRLLEEAAQNIYREWFVHFRFPGHEQAEFGEDACPPNGRGVPVGWEVSTFFEKVDIMSGGTPKTSEPSYWDGDIPFFTPKDASSTDHLYITETQKKLTEEGLARCNSKLYPKDTVFITARGTVGKVRLTMTDMAMNQSCYALKMSNGTSQLFLVGAIHEAVSHLKKTATGGVFDTIIVDTFKQIPIVIPEIGLIELYHSTVAPIFKQTECLQNQNIRLKEARDILLPRLMNRTIEV